MKNGHALCLSSCISLALAGVDISLADQRTTSQRTTIEEITVTAQRREQAVQDVPVAITALSQSMLEERGITDYATYLRTIPGASFAENSTLGNEVKFRGVGSGSAALSPTTAIYLGEVPIIHTGRNVNSSFNPRLVDMERIEVLRGPQGQLYGANSLGGAIKQIPRSTDLEAFGVALNAGTSSTRNGGSGYDADLTLNLPIIANRAGVRLTVYTAEEGGWYDNIFEGGPTMAELAATAPPLPPPGAPFPPGPGALLPMILMVNPDAANFAAAPNIQRGVNTSRVKGGRLVSNWVIGDQTSAELILAYEERSAKGNAWAEAIENIPGPRPGTVIVPNTVNPMFSLIVTQPSDYRSFQYADPVTPSTGDELKLANLVVEHDFEGARLTSSTAYWDRTESLATGLSAISFITTGVANTIPVLVQREDNPRSLSQELRLASTSDSPLQWLGGLYFQRINQGFTLAADDLSGLNILFTEALLRQPPGTPPPPMEVARQWADYRDEQAAVFGEIAYDLTPTLTAAFSFRWFTLKQEADIRNAGFQFTGQSDSTADNRETIFTPRFSLTWSPDDRFTHYAAVAEGYRTGVVNRDLPLELCGAELASLGYPDGLPPTDADTVWNFEVGSKMLLADRRVQLNAAAYHTRWSDLQTQIFLQALAMGPSRCQADGLLNVSDARIDGVELEVSALLTDWLRVDAAFARTRARYTDDFAPAGIASGQKVELTPEVSGYVGLNLDFRLLDRESFARIDWSYVGKMESKGGDFVSQLQPEQIGDYHQVNARIGMRLVDELSLEFWVNNLFDSFGVTNSLDTGGLTAPLVITTRPRTFGATMRYRF